LGHRFYFYHSRNKFQDFIDGSTDVNLSSRLSRYCKDFDFYDRNNFKSFKMA
jgi:hypothetical protein